MGFPERRPFHANPPTFTRPRSTGDAFPLADDESTQWWPLSPDPWTVSLGVSPIASHLAMECTGLLLLPACGACTV